MLMLSVAELLTSPVLETRDELSMGLEVAAAELLYALDASGDVYWLVEATAAAELDGSFRDE